ncbi:MAG: M23 family metallopeptidase, partial [Flammeovirgaceae bacterium]|nr:M23 family metallopeptidase [Flammeovirgaceae bacterium]MDW8288443.1 M23 family metallopeptidase [Flammeovirgaceae bacterium]
KLKEIQLKQEKEQKAKQKNACPTDELVPVGNCLFIPEKYLTTEEYFAIWDTENVNPYGYNIQAFKDSVYLTLFCDEKGKHWSYPLKATEINSAYGVRRFRFHHGIDLDLNVGEPIYAVFDGVVRIAKNNRRGYGNYVLIRHDNGLETLYGHLKTYFVRPGQLVKAGQMIGLGGNTGRSTGPHLHFEIRYRGHAFNPTYIFDFEKEQILAQSFLLTPAHYEKIIEENKTVYHRIRSGDSIWTLSKRYHVPISTLCKMNGITAKTVLRIGSMIRVR